MRPYGESFAVGGSNCHEFSHGGAEFRLPSCDADATLPLRAGQPDFGCLTTQQNQKAAPMSTNQPQSLPRA